MWHRNLAWMEPVDAASRLGGLPELALLDSAMTQTDLGRYSYLAVDPFGVFEVHAGVATWNGDKLPGAPLAALRAKLAAYRCDVVAGLPPFQGGAIGFVSYEFGWALEARTPPASPRGADMRFAFYDTIVAFDHREKAAFIVTSGFPAEASKRGVRARQRIAQFADLLSRCGAAPSDEVPAIVWRPTASCDAYRAAVERVQGYIAAGDIYQANIAQRFAATLPADAAPWALYRHLRSANPAPFAAYLDCGARKVLSMSPELFLRTEGRRVETRPIKGTARRASEPGADRAAGEALLASSKDRAENVMIVDLLRNDLSRVCVPRSVDVPTLCALESYAGLHHLVSAVVGDLRQEADALDLLAACFPGGSITGAPKLRAMEIIAEIEGMSRGVYCGAIGAIGFHGGLAFSIAIRTLVIDGTAMELCAGGGITMLSDADQEYEETLTKARRVFEACASVPAAGQADVRA